LIYDEERVFPADWRIMASSLSCYYLDEPLNGNDLAFVTQTLVGPWARFKTGAASLVQRRVPAVLPAPDIHGVYAHDREQRAEGIRKNLRHAGIGADAGRQVVWVMPRDTDWDAIFQFAIREETGLAPFVVQRWFLDDGQPVRKPARVVDTQLLLQGL